MLFQFSFLSNMSRSHIETTCREASKLMAPFSLYIKRIFLVWVDANSKNKRVKGQLIKNKKGNLCF